MSGLNFENDGKLRTCVRRVSRWGTLCGLFAMLALVTGCPPPPVACTADADCDDTDACTTDTCGADGVCENTNACTADEVCVAERGELGTGDNVCVAVCDTDPECDDDDACNGNETCDAGVCSPGTDLDCDDGDNCTNDSCDATSGCVNDPVVCNPGDECNPDTGVCEPIPCVDDAGCDNSNVCDGAESCNADSVCEAGTALNCDDGDLCTDDTCDAANGCANTAVDCGTQTCDPLTGGCVDVVVEAFTVTADASATQAEGDSGATNFTFTVNRTGGTAAKTLDYAVTSGSGTTDASADDFVGAALPSGTVDFAVDENGDKTITIAVAGDMNVEQDEAFTLTVTDAGTEVGTAGGTIQNDDSTANPVNSLPTNIGAQIGQASAITGITVSDSDNNTLDVNLQTSDGLFNFTAIAAGTTVRDVNGNNVAAAQNVREATLSGTVANINTTLQNLVFTTDRVTGNPGTDVLNIITTDPDGGSDSDSLNIPVGESLTLTTGNDTTLTATAGADSFNGAANTIGSGDILDGLDGPDSLVITGNTGNLPTGPTAGTFAVNNVETVWANGSAGNTIWDLADINQVDTFRWSASGNNNLTLNNAPNGITLIVDTFNASPTGSTITVAVIPTLGQQIMTLNLRGNQGTPLSMAVFAGVSIENLSLDSGSSDGNTVTNTMTGTSTFAANTVTITGAQDLLMGTWNAAENFNAGSFTGDLTLTGTLATGVSIIGGTGDDTINGSAGADDLQGGPGADTIDGTGQANATGLDVITGGTGADQLRFSRSTASGAPAAVGRIADWEDGTDSLGISAANTFGGVGGGVGLAAGTGAIASLVIKTAGNVVVTDVAKDAAATGIGTTEFIKLTTGVAALGTDQLTFNSAIGTATLTGTTILVTFAGSYFDTTNNQAVIFEVITTNGANNSVQSGDTIFVIARINMTATEYTNFTTADIHTF